MLPRELRQTYASVVTATAAMVIKKDPGLVTWTREPGGAATRRTEHRRRRTKDLVSVGRDIWAAAPQSSSLKGMGYISD